MEKHDYIDSFFFTETLKYAFLLFDKSGKGIYIKWYLIGRRV